ncbi:MAG: family 1 glycosylhydrolase [Acidimicrobiales bacterium]
MTLRRADFGEDFTWGVASAAFQIEGAWDVDGKRPSVWDEACRNGRVRDGLVCLDAIDAFHRSDEDLDLIASLGVDANRFSINWPRVYGDGRAMERGRRGLLRPGDRRLPGGGVEPWVTVHHWDLPLALQREGAGPGGIVDDFAAFAEEVARRYGDRVKHWMVFNEPLSVVGHIAAGIHGRIGPHPMAALASLHHMNLACAEAGRRMHAVLSGGVDRDDERVQPRRAVRRHRVATPDAARHRGVDRGRLPGSSRRRGYPFDDSPFLRPLRRYVRDGDLEAAAFDYDFMGVQYYGPFPTKKVPVLGGIPVPRLDTAEADVRSTTKIPVEPRGLIELFRRYRDHPACKRFVVTECGFGMNDRMVDGPSPRRPADLVHPQPPGGGARGGRRRPAGRRLLPVELRRQHRVGVRPQRPVRADLRRLRRRLPPHPEGLVPVVPAVAHRRRWHRLSRVTPAGRPSGPSPAPALVHAHGEDLLHGLDRREGRLQRHGGAAAVRRPQLELHDHDRHVGVGRAVVEAEPILEPHEPGASTPTIRHQPCAFEPSGPVM